MSQSADDTIPTELEHAGATRLVRQGGKFLLKDALGVGPTLKLGGLDVSDGQLGSWRPVGAEHVTGGYLVAWKDDATGQYIVWRTDDGGNKIANATGMVRGNDDSLRDLEDDFGQDLNGDSVLGAPHRELEHLGRTYLTQAGAHYELDDSLGNGPHLRHGGNDVLEGQFGTWRPIGAEHVTGGYLVAWKDDASGQYIVWRTDDAGNYLGNATSVVRGSDDSLRHLEDDFGQDLNDDSMLGAPHRELEHLGRTFLTQDGGRFRLDDSLGAGPSLKDNGADVLEGQLGSWRPIGAEATAGGYLVAWKDDASGQYIVWRTDAQGNKTANATGIVRGNDDGFRHLEDDFGQDLNDDRVLGGNHREIEHQGGIHLTQVGGRFFLSDDLVQGQSLKFGGDDVLEHQFGTWRPISAEHSGAGYLVAWQDDSTGSYIVWTTDDRGNHTGSATGIVRGTDDSLERLEIELHHDLNGDHHDGIWHG